LTETQQLDARQTGPGRPRPHDIDRHVGARIRQRRVLLGLTQQQLADLIGVTYQQAHKYEKGVNRIAVGRLYSIAKALAVDVAHFYEGLDGDSQFRPTAEQSLMIDLARNFVALRDPSQQEAICRLARAMASIDTASQSRPDRPALGKS